MDLDKLRALLDRPGYSQAGLAQAMNLNPAAISRMLKGKRHIKSHEIGTITRYLDTTDDLLAKEPPSIKPQHIVTVPLQRGPNTLPVFGATEGKGGVWMIDPIPIDMVERPDFLRYSTHAFGIYCNGTQQAPVFEPRDLVIVDPNKPHAIGDDVVLVKHYSIGEAVPFQGILRRLIGQTDTHWHVRQFNPPHDYKVTKEEWPRALYVAGKYSR